MSEQEKATAKRLNALLAKMTEQGRERLLDYCDGYNRGFRDGKNSVSVQAASKEGSDAPCST